MFLAPEYSKKIFTKKQIIEIRVSSPPNGLKT